MMDFLTVLAVLTHTLRYALFAGGLLVAAIASLDWAVRTRRINPFNGIARFMRGRVEPRLAGIERQVLRSGGHPSATPWWALLAYAVCAVVLLGAVDLFIGLTDDAIVATKTGAGGIGLLVVHWTFALLRIALLIRVVTSWFPRLAANRLLAWSYPATEWMLRPLRAVLPTIGAVDLSPIVAYFALQITEWLIHTVLVDTIR